MKFIVVFKPFWELILSNELFNALLSVLNTEILAAGLANDFPFYYSSSSSSRIFVFCIPFWGSSFCCIEIFIKIYGLFNIIVIFLTSSLCFYTDYFMSLIIKYLQYLFLIAYFSILLISLLLISACL